MSFHGVFIYLFPLPYVDNGRKKKEMYDYYICLMPYRGSAFDIIASHDFDIRINLSQIFAPLSPPVTNKNIM